MLYSGYNESMKYAGIVLLTGFISVAVFGVFGMNHGGGQSHDMASSNCIAATAKGTGCPEEASPINAVAFHLDTLKDFSLAIFGEDLSVSFLMFVLLATSIGFLILLGNTAPPRFNFAYERYKPGRLDTSSKRKFFHWIALHENSPSVF